MWMLILGGVLTAAALTTLAVWRAGRALRFAVLALGAAGGILLARWEPIDVAHAREDVVVKRMCVAISRELGRFQYNFEAHPTDSPSSIWFFYAHAIGPVQDACILDPNDCDVLLATRPSDPRFSAALDALAYAFETGHSCPKLSSLH
jgi:hypothetical protein